MHLWCGQLDVVLLNCQGPKGLPAGQWLAAIGGPKAPAPTKGNAGAQITLGWMYANGRGVPQDYAQAAAWLRKLKAEGILEAEGVADDGSPGEGQVGVASEPLDALSLPSLG
jgi:TPR repeat protein